MSTKTAALAAKDGAADWLIDHEWVVGVGVGLNGSEHVIKVLCSQADSTWPVEWDGVPIEYEEGHETPKAQDV